MPDDPATRLRLMEQAKTNRQELITMIESIMATKEQDEREDQADDLARLNRLRAPD